MSVTPSLTPTSPQSITIRRTKSISVQCGRCSKRSSSWVAKSSVDERIPFKPKNAEIHRVPSGVSNNVLASRKLNVDGFFDKRCSFKDSTNLSLLGLRAFLCFSFAQYTDATAGSTRGRALSLTA